ncbi:hypothetical protein FSP39_021490 [Pinctada imbricata]|uniref:C-type lectin domain-containing protein n=1 Tax=Pinctada imbricata TaxID=66713 RepID=A0AA88YVD8_PINIB|nr:hypothetical protein FSP39_021490 [Pinctada imbricata]
MYFSDSNKQNTSYWIGGNDIEAERHFVWVGTGSDLAYNRWYPGQPDAASYKQDCIEMYGRDNFEWHDVGCEAKNYFIYETK